MRSSRRRRSMRAPSSSGPRRTAPRTTASGRSARSATATSACTRPANRTWTTDGPWANRELVAAGDGNVFILQIGDRAQFGSYSRLRRPGQPRPDQRQRHGRRRHPVQLRRARRQATGAAHGQPRGALRRPGHLQPVARFESPYVDGTGSACAPTATRSPTAIARCTTTSASCAPTANGPRCAARSTARTTTAATWTSGSSPTAGRWPRSPRTPWTRAAGRSTSRGPTAWPSTCV